MPKFCNIDGKKIGEDYQALFRNGKAFPEVLAIFLVLASKAQWRPEEMLEAIAEAAATGDASGFKNYFRS